jgi:hypothetical protein
MTTSRTRREIEWCRGRLVFELILQSAFWELFFLLLSYRLSVEQYSPQWGWSLREKPTIVVGAKAVRLCKRLTAYALSQHRTLRASTRNSRGETAHEQSQGVLRVVVVGLHMVLP